MDSGHPGWFLTATFSQDPDPKGLKLQLFPIFFAWTGFSSMAIEFLVGGLEHVLFFHIIIGNFFIPTDEVHHFSEG
jgi:hypothetical protein